MIDKSLWGDGPWQNEVDRLEWIDSATKLPCVIRRSEHGTLCGYVNAGYYLDVYVYAHGGITFTGPMPDGWWVGFDCAHGGDLTPATHHILKAAGFPELAENIYRDMDYVREQVRLLAKQLKEAYDLREQR